MWVLFDDSSLLLARANIVTLYEDFHYNFQLGERRSKLIAGFWTLDFRPAPMRGCRSFSEHNGSVSVDAT